MNDGSNLVAIESTDDVSTDFDMWLDVASPKSAAITIIGFLTALVLTLWAGLSGPEPFTSIGRSITSGKRLRRCSISTLLEFRVTTVSCPSRCRSSARPHRRTFRRSRSSIASSAQLPGGIGFPSIAQRPSLSRRTSGRTN
jgi:hypothetical protein